MVRCCAQLPGALQAAQLPAPRGSKHADYSPRCRYENRDLAALQRAHLKEKQELHETVAALKKVGPDLRALRPQAVQRRTWEAQLCAERSRLPRAHSHPPVKPSLARTAGT